MKYYDIVLITNQEKFLINKNIASIINNIVIYNNFIILKIEYCGIRNFMYKIKNYNKGYYMMMSFSGSNYLINKIYNFLKNNSFILRFLILKFIKKNYYLSSFILNDLYERKI